MKNIKIKFGDETKTIAGFLLWQVSRLWQRRLALAVNDLRLSGVQAVVLANILRFTKESVGITQTQLSTATKVDRTTTSLALRALEQAGLVTRVASSTDRRAYQVRLTVPGQKMAAETIKRFAVAHKEFFKPLKNENPEIVNYLQRLIQANDF